MRLYNFNEIAALTTGTHIEDYEEYRRQVSDIENASEAMARRLMCVGVDVYAAPNDGDIFAVGDVTGAVERVSAGYKNKSFIPVIAKKMRASWIKELNFFLNNDPQGHLARYGVITSGTRIPFSPYFVDEAGSRISKMRGNVRRWIGEARDRYGIDVILRTLENALSSESAHPHINVIYIPRERLGAEKWSRFLAWSRSRLGAHWQDCGRLRDVREVVKYCCKLQGQDSIESLSDTNLKLLYELMDKRSTIEAGGSFAEFRKEVVGKDKRVVQARNRLHLMRKQKREANQSTDSREERRPAENIILGRQLPRPFASSLKEPVSLVKGLNMFPQTGVGLTGLGILLTRHNEALNWARENGDAAASFNVHNITPTVQLVPDRGMDIEANGASPATLPPDDRRFNAYHQRPRRIVPRPDYMIKRQRPVSSYPNQQIEQDKSRRCRYPVSHNIVPRPANLCRNIPPAQKQAKRYRYPISNNIVPHPKSTFRKIAGLSI